jgi:hypothetical protein
MRHGARFACCEPLRAAFPSSIEKETSMKFKAIVLGMSLIAFAGASAYANDASKNKSDSQAKSPASQSSSAKTSGATPSGSASSGGSTGASAGGAARLDFDKADKNKDGQLSRAEFDAMTKGDSSATAGASSSKDLTKPSSTSGAKGSEPKSSK